MTRISKSLILCLVICLLCSIAAFAATDKDVKGTEMKVSHMKAKAFTKEDKANGYKDYASYQSVYTYNYAYLGRAVGIVYDEDTEDVLKNAWVENLELGFKVKTDDKGRFEINNLPDGNYTWIVKAPGYVGSTFTNFPVESAVGASIYRFALSSKKAINSDIRLERMTKHEEPDDEEHDLNPIQGSDTTKNYDSMSIGIMAIHTDWPTIVNFTVSYNNTLYALDMDEYLYFVVASELWAPTSSLYSGMTADQLLEGFKAQAITARTYADYITRMYNKHTGYDVCSTTCCQVYNPYYTNQTTVAAVDATANQMMLVVYDTATYNYDFVEAVFSASCLGSTKDNEDVWGGSPKTYLRGVSCPYDLRPTLDSGHNIGLCQDGAMGYAKNNYKHDYILKHFFTGVSLITCKTQADIGLEVGETTIAQGYYWREYILQIPTAGTYTFKTSKYIDTNTTTNDTVIELYNSSRTLLDSNDDGAGERFSLLTKYLSAGTYYVKVHDWNMDNAINYAFTISNDSALPVAKIGSSATTSNAGNFVTRVAKKRYAIVPTTSKSYTIETLRLNVASDTYLRLYDASGNQLAYNDDSNGVYSKITYSLTAGTRYYLEVSTYKYETQASPAIFDCELRIY